MEDTATALLAARGGGPLVSLATQRARHLSLAEAYGIQRNVCSRVGPIGGWKVGAAGPGATPVWAPVFAADILENGAGLARTPGSMIGIEVEIAFRIAGKLVAERSAARGPADLVDAAYLVIEYVESRLEDPAQAEDGWKLADNQINGGLVIGGAIADWRDTDLKTQPVRLMVDGKTAIDETRSNPGGHPHRLIDWAADQGESHCGGLVAGQIITTGSLTGIQWYEAGTRIRAELPKLNCVVILNL